MPKNRVIVGTGTKGELPSYRRLREISGIRNPHRGEESLAKEKKWDKQGRGRVREKEGVPPPFEPPKGTWVLLPSTIEREHPPIQGETRTRKRFGDLCKEFQGKEDKGNFTLHGQRRKHCQKESDRSRDRIFRKGGDAGD